MSLAWRAFYSEPHIGNRFSSKKPIHWGCDFNGWPTGTAIPSPCDGIVVASGWNPAYGWYVAWKCEHDKLCGRAHMQKRGLAKGAKFKTGDTVGRVGNTGYYSTGAHTHAFEGTKTPWLGARVNPLPHIIDRMTSFADSGNFIPIEEESNMTTLFKKTSTGTRYLATDFTLLAQPSAKNNTLATAYGDPIDLTDAQLSSVAEAIAGNLAALVAALPVGTVTSSGLTPEEHAMLDDIASKGELSQALTSTVQLVNAHTTAEVDSITLTNQ